MCFLASSPVTWRGRAIDSSRTLTHILPSHTTLPLPIRVTHSSFTSSLCSFLILITNLSPLHLTHLTPRSPRWVSPIHLPSYSRGILPNVYPLTPRIIHVLTFCLPRFLLTHSPLSQRSISTPLSFLQPPSDPYVHTQPYLIHLLLIESILHPQSFVKPTLLHACTLSCFLSSQKDPFPWPAFLPQSTISLHHNLFASSAVHSLVHYDAPRFPLQTSPPTPCQFHCTRVSCS